MWLNGCLRPPWRWQVEGLEAALAQSSGVAVSLTGQIAAAMTDANAQVRRRRARSDPLGRLGSVSAAALAQLHGMGRALCCDALTSHALPSITWQIELCKSRLAGAEQQLGEAARREADSRAEVNSLTAALTALRVQQERDREAADKQQQVRPGLRGCGAGNADSRTRAAGGLEQCPSAAWCRTPSRLLWRRSAPRLRSVDGRSRRCRCCWEGAAGRPRCRSPA
jgi:hypothetical protein